MCIKIINFKINNVSIYIKLNNLTDIFDHRNKNSTRIYVQSKSDFINKIIKYKALD